MEIEADNLERCRYGIVLVDDVSVLNEVHEERLFVFAESYHERIGRHFAGDEYFGIGRGGYTARQQERAVHQRVGYFDQQFVVIRNV